MTMGARPTVFISHVHADAEWKHRLVLHLSVLAKQGILDVWDEDNARPGEDRSSEIANAIDRAAVAVLLISASYLSSDAIVLNHVQRVLARRREGLVVIPIYVRPCDWVSVDWLQGMQMRPSSNTPLSAESSDKVEAHLVGIAREVATALNSIVKAEERREVQARVEGSAAEYITASLDELRRREKTDRRLAHLWYVTGYLSLIGGTTISAWRIYKLGSLPPSGWVTLAEFTILGIVAVGMLLALAKYAFTLGKSFMVEALRHADRIHAISFGYFYLKAFGAQAEWGNVKEALQHWNIDRGSSFLSQEPGHFDPKLIEVAAEIAKVLAGKIDPKK